MGYKIEPVTIWQDGQAKTGNVINASIVNDNLTNYAQFYWTIDTVIVNSDNTETLQVIAQGNTTITGDAYVQWGEQSDVNLAAYQYICAQLNLNLIP